MAFQIKVECEFCGAELTVPLSELANIDEITCQCVLASQEEINFDE